MTFALAINQVAHATHSQNNSVTNGRTTFQYHQLPSLFSIIDHYLHEQEITNDQCLALECANSATGALVLLYLLQKRYCFMLLPPTGNTEASSVLKPLPTFCQYRLRLKPLADGADTDDIWHPRNWLVIQANEHYRTEPNEASQASEKLYLRTSGSMGASKIVVHSHARLFGNAQNCVQRFQLSSEHRVAIAVPIFHMYGLGAGFLPAVMAGASIDLQEHTNLVKYLERERQFKPDAAFLTPALCDMLLQRRGGSRIYRVAVSAGARLKEEIVRAFDERFGSLVNLYGSTELGAISAAAPDDALEVRATTIGRAMNAVTLAPASQVSPTEQQQADAAPPTEDTQVDELFCQHPWGFECYIDEHGRQISQAATWFRTGDLAKLASDGTIQILGRADNSINRDGYLVLLADIERTMERIEAIAQVVALTSQAERQRGQYLAACCIPKPGASLDSAQIRAACFDILPRYAVPDEIFVLDVLPTLPSGKVDRQALIAQVGVGHD
jgi:acyl-CoA synthetase (AMP-forming)/AMP-acid ligase II